jgi:hypothetical protein
MGEVKVKLAERQRLRPLAVVYAGFLGLFFLASDVMGAEALTDEQIRELILKESIANYSGTCPCPYSEKTSGEKCGDSSAYRKPGGQKPLCYQKDISPGQVDKYRKKHNITKPKSDR